MTFAYLCFTVLEQAIWIAMLVYAYGQGGATTAGLVAVAQLLPAAAFAPFAATYADRRPVPVLVGGLLVQSATAAATAAVMLSGLPAVYAYGGAVMSSVAMTLTRPAVSAIAPALARSPRELGACNVVQGWMDQGGAALAGLLTGALLAVSDPAVVFGVGAALALVGAVPVRRLRVSSVALPEGSSSLRDLRGGLAVLRSNAAARLTVAVMAALFVLLGALDVLYVVLARDVLRLGPGWAGYLNTAAAMGGIAAGAVTAGLVGRRLGRPLLVAASGSSVAIALTALSGSVAVTAILLACVGAGGAVMLVTTRTLLQRTVPTDVVGRVFGLVEGVSMAGLAIGSLVITILVDLGGPSTALVGIGLVLPLTVLVGRRTMAILDSSATVPAVEIALLRSLPHFAELPTPELEGLARALVATDVETGAVVFRQGQRGDHFYAVADGEVEISIDGRPVRRQGRGSGFGEIALVRHVPRTATVTARAPTRLYALDRDTFLRVLTNNDRTRHTTEAVADAWDAG